MRRLFFMLVLALVLPLVAAQEAHDHGHEVQAETDAQGHVVEAERDWSGIVFTLIVGLLVISGVVFFFRGLEGRDLLEYRLLKRVLKSRLYPAIL